VAPSLIWGRGHTKELEERLDAAMRTRGLDQIVQMAQQNLPEKVTVSPKLYFVMGGRAGAAKLDDGIYFDLLAGPDRGASRKDNIVRYFCA
jgi:hypothetical protein